MRLSRRRRKQLRRDYDEMMLVVRDEDGLQALVRLPRWLPGAWLGLRVGIGLRVG